MRQIRLGYRGQQWLLLASSNRCLCRLDNVVDHYGDGERANAAFFWSEGDITALAQAWVDITNDNTAFACCASINDHCTCFDHIRCDEMGLASSGNDDIACSNDLCGIRRLAVAHCYRQAAVAPQPLQWCAY